MVVAATMRTVNLYGADDFRLERMPVPTPAAGEVLLRVMVCGICGSDLSYVSRGGLLGPSDQAMPLGHELSAVVESVGEGVPGVESGMRVVVNPMEADNMIGNGGPEGGFADFLLVRNAAQGCLLPLPDTVSFHEGALVEPLAVSTHAVNVAEPAAGERAAVFGAGAIGLGIVAVLAQRGVRDIVAVDPSAKRRQLALQLGATAAVSPSDAEPWGSLREHHGAQPFFGRPHPTTELFFDAVGSAAVVEGIVSGSGAGARLVVVGVHTAPVSLDLTTVLMKDFRLQGSMGYPNDEFRAAVELLSDPDFDAAPLMSAHFDLDDFPQAFAAARDPEHGAKILVEIGV